MSTYWIIFIAIALASYLVQANLNNKFKKYSRIPLGNGMTGREVAEKMLRDNGIYDVRVISTPGQLTDHYDPGKELLNLSEGVYGSGSVAALGIAAHEAGHAMQKLEGYAPLKLRTAAVPVVNIGSRASTAVVLLGLVFSWQPLVYIGIALFSLSVLFSLITLPVEFDASNRAIRMLTEGGYVTESERSGVKAVLNAAALTYVASAVTSILSLLRLLMIARSRDRD